MCIRDSPLREPSPRRGILIMIDGTPHDWFQNGRKSSLHLEMCIRDSYKGNLKLSSPTLLKTSTYAPTIMGPFSYFKYMQCNHGIISLSSHVSGTLVVDGKKLDMNGGTCYIEKRCV